jgi:hypothetical protein
MSYRSVVFLLIFAVSLARWLWSAGSDFSSEQAYLALSGYAPSIAVLEGPAGTPVLVAYGVKIFGSSALGATFFWGLLAAATSLGLVYLLGPIIGRPAALFCVVLLNVLPVFNLAAINPSPALAVTCGGVYLFAFAWRALNQQSLGYWVATGVSSAIALFFSYAALLLLPSLFLAVATSRRWRSQRQIAGYLLAVIPTLLVLAQLIWWNLKHDWIHFIGGTWQTVTTLHAGLFFPSVLHAAYSVTPVVLIVLALASVAASTQVSVARKLKFLFLPATILLAATVYLTLRGSMTSANVGLLATSLSLGLIAWLPVILSERAARIVLVVSLLTATLWTSISFIKAPRALSDINAEVAALVETLRQQLTSNATAPVFLIAQTPQLAAALSLQLPDISWVQAGHPPVYVVESPFAGNQFALWPRYDQISESAPIGTSEQDPFTEQDGANAFIGRSALYITSEELGNLPQAITAAFVSHELIGTIQSPSGALLKIYLCLDYQTLPL